ncbi:hypothetical protein EV702DRAFT_1144210 [Suillus placidus]|uniref:Uncharacterized protein n=1 Tax=Suillus placidus TaxID=48579 RepID=A0A9P6ZK26_9AGAM|nr:hypothetical protein EV702DRAFT_1144210 [Suillus placidus]
MVAWPASRLQVLAVTMSARTCWFILHMKLGSLAVGSEGVNATTLPIASWVMRCTFAVPSRGGLRLNLRYHMLKRA